MTALQEALCGYRVQHQTTEHSDGDKIQDVVSKREREREMNNQKILVGVPDTNWTLGYLAGQLQTAART